jgi:glycolate oxidase FAD binding subunit
MLDERGQMLGFEPSSLEGMWEAPHGATIGGTIAAGIAGPRRFAIGGGRDHLLGFSAVNGRGERFKAGGSVVKNVTGYDLPKLAAGSFGTLFAMTELTVRVYPKAMETRALCFEGLDVNEGLSVLREMRRSPLEPSGLSYLPATAGHPSRTLCRFEGEAEGVAQRIDAASRLASHAARTLPAAECHSAFDRIANVAAFFGDDTSIWRVSVPPAEAAAFIASIGDTAWFADGAGSVVWLEADIGEIHGSARARGGHALLVRRRKGTKAPEDAFQPMDEPMSALVGRLKDAFDPCRILNPGRMYRGI